MTDGKRSWVNALCGGLSGCVGKTITAPLSRVTILLQIGDALEGSSAGVLRAGGAGSPGLAISMSRLWKAEGILSFWRGNFTSVLHRFPYSAINFGVYEKARAMMGTVVEETPLVRFCSGALAGGIATVACYPLDLIRTRLVVQSPSDSSAAKSSKNATIARYNSINHALKTVFLNEGTKGLYAGLGMSLAVAIPNLAIGYTVYGTAKQRLEESNQLVDSSGKLSTLGSLACGSVSGLLASLFTFPADVVKHLMQVNGMKGHSASAYEVVLSVTNASGVSGLYRGLTPELVKVVPMTACTWMAYEFFHDIFHGLNRY